MLEVEKAEGHYFANWPPEGATEDISKHCDLLSREKHAELIWHTFLNLKSIVNSFIQCRVCLFQPSEHVHREAVCLVFTHALHSLWEGVEAVGLLGVGEGHSHAWCEWGVKNDSRTLIARSQVHRWDRANALTVHNHILWSDAIPARKTQDIWISCFCRWVIGYLSSN